MHLKQSEQIHFPLRSTVLLLSFPQTEHSGIVIFLFLNFNIKLMSFEKNQ